MLRNALIVILLVVVVFGSLQAEVTSQSRVLFHGSKQITENWGMAGWSIFPNIVQDTKNVTIVGPRYDYANGWVEILAGQLVTSEESSSLFSTRFFSKHLPINFWGEIQYFPKDKTLYWFLEANYPIKFDGKLLGKIGVETENVHQPGSFSSLGAGPRFIIPVAKNMTIITAYQWRHKENNVFRFYTVFDF